MLWVCFGCALGVLWVCFGCVLVFRFVFLLLYFVFFSIYSFFLLLVFVSVFLLLLFFFWFLFLFFFFWFVLFYFCFGFLSAFVGFWPCMVLALQFRATSPAALGGGGGFVHGFTRKTKTRANRKLWVCAFFFQGKLVVFFGLLGVSRECDTRNCHGVLVSSSFPPAFFSAGGLREARAGRGLKLGQAQAACATQTFLEVRRVETCGEGHGERSASCGG